MWLDSWSYWIYKSCILKWIETAQTEVIQIVKKSKQNQSKQIIWHNLSLKSLIMSNTDESQWLNCLVYIGKVHSKWIIIWIFDWWKQSLKRLLHPTTHPPIHPIHPSFQDYTFLSDVNLYIHLNFLIFSDYYPRFWNNQILIFKFMIWGGGGGGGGGGVGQIAAWILKIKPFLAYLF